MRRLQTNFWMLMVPFLVSAQGWADEVKPIDKRPSTVNTLIFGQSKCTPIFDMLLVTLPGNLGKLCVNWARCEYKKRQANDTDSLLYRGLACFPVNGRCENLEKCALRATTPPATVPNRKRKIKPDYQSLKEDKPRKGQQGMKASIKETENEKGKKEQLPKEVAIIDKFPPSDQVNGPDGTGNFCMIPVQTDPPDPKIPGVVMCSANGAWPNLDCPGIYECIEKRFDWEKAAMAQVGGTSTSGLALTPALRRHSNSDDSDIHEGATDSAAAH